MAQTKEQIIKECKLTIPLEAKGKDFYDHCRKKGFSRFIVSRDLLEVSNTTGRTVSLCNDYVIKIDADLKVSIDKVTPVKK